MSNNYMNQSFQFDQNHQNESRTPLRTPARARVETPILPPQVPQPRAQQGYQQQQQQHQTPQQQQQQTQQGQQGQQQQQQQTPQQQHVQQHQQPRQHPQHQRQSIQQQRQHQIQQQHQQQQQQPQQIPQSIQQQPMQVHPQQPQANLIQQLNRSQEVPLTPVYHTAGDPIAERPIPPHLAYQFGSKAQAEAAMRQQQLFTNNPQASPSDADVSMQTYEEEEMDEDDDDEEGEGGNSANNGQGTTKDGVPYVAPLTQPITPLQLPKIRPTLLLGPYDSREDAHNAVQEYAISQGYVLVQSGCAKQKTPGGKYTSGAEVVRVDLMCDRGGICKNTGTGRRKRPTHRIGCPARMKLVCRKREASKWFIDIRCEEHNHDLDPSKIHLIAAYRRWRRVQAGGPSTEPIKERHARTRKPKTIPPVPPPKFHQVGGLNVQPPSTPTTPLHMAALKGQCKIMSILLDRGADINALDSTGRTALHCGIEGQRMDVVKLLVERGADVTKADSKGLSPLHFAVEKGMEDAVVLFIEMGADPNK